MRTRHGRVHRIPHSTFVTIAIRPSLVEAGWREEITDFGKTEAEYFSREDWTVESALNCFTKFDFARTRFLNGRGCVVAIDAD
jgi:hypothetical protein